MENRSIGAEPRNAAATDESSVERLGPHIRAHRVEAPLAASQIGRAVSPLDVQNASLHNSTDNTVGRADQPETGSCHRLSGHPFVKEVDGGVNKLTISQSTEERLVREITNIEKGNDSIHGSSQTSV